MNDNTRAQATNGVTRAWSRMRSLPTEIYALIAVAVPCVGVALTLSLHSDVLDYQQEWVHALLQAGLIAVLGIVTAAILETFKDALQNRRVKGKVRFDVFDEINRTYLDVKLVRRNVQTVGALSKEDVTLLNKRQLLLEHHKNNSSALFSDPIEVQKRLRNMERYLNKVANNPSSDEHGKFAARGFDAFADDYHALADLLRPDVTSIREPSPKADEESLLGGA